MTEMRSRASLRRRLARVSVTGAIVCLVLAGLGQAGAQDVPPPRPDVFRAAATSEVASAFLDREALLPVNDAFRFVALDGTGTFESSNQTARSSIFYPGNGVVSGPALACDTFGGQFPEQFAPVLDACRQYQYPLSVFADSLHPDASTSGSAQLGAPADPVSARAVRAVAHAAEDAATTDATIAALRVTGLPALGTVALPVPAPGGAPELDSTVFAVDHATSRTDQRIDAAGHLVVEAHAVLDGVHLLGGLILIDSIRTDAVVTDDGRGTQTHDATLTVDGVTVAGVPAEITEKGLVVGSPTGADGPLVQQLTGTLNQLLDGLGVEVTTLAVEDGVDDAGLAYARAGGVMVEFHVDAQGLPMLPGPQGDIDPNGTYTGTIRLGDAGVTGVATDIEDAVFTPGASSPDTGFEPAPFVASDFAASSPSFDPSLGDVAPPDLASAPTGPSASGGPSSDTSQAVLVSQLLATGRVRLTYLAFTLMALAVCLGPRFALPARFPGRTP